MLFIFALPVMQVILFCLAIGRDPTGLRLAIVNHELNQSGQQCEYNSGCSFRMLSCRYLQNLDNESIVKVGPSSCIMTSSFLLRMASSWMLCHVALVRTDVSEELSTSIIVASYS
jgi:hypothetical protein